MWIPIIGFEDRYEIDEFGNVFNKSTNSIMNPYITNKGYKVIDLYKDGKRHKFLIHRLVAIHFVPNPNNYPIVLHLDNVKTNTHYTNLVWGTYSQNNSQAIKDGLNKVPRPDNRVYYEIRDGEEIKCACYGIDEVIDITDYQASNRGMYSLIFRNNPLKGGPYDGCKVYRSHMQPAILFDTVDVQRSSPGGRVDP